MTLNLLAELSRKHLNGRLPTDAMAEPAKPAEPTVIAEVSGHALFQLFFPQFIMYIIFFSA
jgi:hypothetical protein